MSSDQFEHRLREKLREASIPPSDHLWANIEKEVQGKSSKRGFFWWSFLGEGLLLSVLFLIYFFAPTTFQSTSPPIETQQTVTLNLNEPSLANSATADTIAVSVKPTQETSQLTERILEEEPSLIPLDRTATSEVKSYFLSPIQYAEDLNILLTSISTPENSLHLPKQWVLIDTVPTSILSLANVPLPVVPSWEDKVPLAKQPKWAWEANYAYLNGTEGLFSLGFSSDDALETQNLDDGAVESPDPSSAQSPPSDSERTYTITHGQGTHMMGLGGSYSLNRNLFLETGLNLKISEVGEIVENVGFQSLSNDMRLLSSDLVLGSPVNRAVQPEATTFRQYALSIPLGIGLQLGKGKTRFRLSSGIQFEYLRNNAAIELSNLRQQPDVSLFSPPAENDLDTDEISKWQYQNQVYVSGRLLHQINRSLQIQLGAQFQFLQLPSGGSIIANGQDSQGGLQLGFIWTPIRGKIFKFVHQ